MKRKKYILIAALLCFVIISSFVIIYLLKSEKASRYIVNRLSKFTDNAFTVERVQGSLLSGLNLDAIDYRINQQHVFVEQAKIRLAPLELLGGTLHLNRVEMSGITCTLSDKVDVFNGDAINLLPKDALPFKVIADDVRLNRVVLRRGDFQYDIEQLYIRALIDEDSLFLNRFEFNEKDIRIRLTGNAKFISPYSFQAALRWEKEYKNNRFRGKCDLQGDIDTIRFNHRFFEPRDLRVGGEVKVRRTSPNIYLLGFSGDLSGQTIPPTNIQASGQGNLQHFELEKFTAKTLGGEIHSSGNMLWQSSPQWDFNMDGTDINPGQQWALWKGKLDFGAKVGGRINAGVPEIRINSINVAGDLLNQPFQTSGDVFYKDGEVTLENLSVRSGKNQLALNGTASQNSNLRFEFDIPEPVNLWTGIYGHFIGNGMVKGDLHAPAGRIILDGYDMRYGDYRLKTAAATIEIDLKNTSASNGRAQLHDFRVSDQYFSDISIDWIGDFKKHRVLTNIVSPSTTMDLSFNGSCFKDDCKLKIDIASFDLQQYGSWQLINPVNLSLGPEEVKPFSSCWSQDELDICLNTTWSDAGGWKTSGDVDAPEVASILVVLKEVLNKEHLGWDTHNNQ